METKRTFITFGNGIAARQAALNALFVPGEEWTHVKSGIRCKVRYVDVHGYVVMGFDTGGVHHLWPHEVGPDDWRHESKREIGH